MNDPIYHGTDAFHIVNVKPLSVLADDASQHLPSPVQVLIQFRYEVHSCDGTAFMQTNETRITRDDVWNREISCQLYLTELKGFYLSFRLLSPELSKLGVDQEKHMEIVARTVECANFVEDQIKQFNSKVAIVPIQVELLRLVTVLRCIPCSLENQQSKLYRMGMTRFFVMPKTAGGGGESATSCSICLEEFNAGTFALRTPCSHEFHEKCIVTWMLQNLSCPLCRHEFSVPSY